jgi:glycosyltransferase involved in cell wall biosynthesis
MVTFSVVIPAYNEAKYICRTLAALKNQTFKDVEIIVKDGKSQDQTVKIAKRFTKKVISQKDTSAADARNQGAHNATGQILVFIDADTALPPETLAHFHELMKNQDIVGVSCRKVPQSSSTLDRVMYEFVNISTYVSSVMRIGGAHGNLMLIRRHAFEQVGGFNPNIIVAEEQDLVRRATKYGKYKFLLDYSVLENPRRLQTWGRLRIYMAWLIGMYKSFRAGKRQPYEKIR